MEQNGTILICPLNWGLGHVSRDIPIIRRLLDKNFRVIVAGGKVITDLICSEFPEIETELLPDVEITYSISDNQTIILLRQLPKAVFSLFREKRVTARLVKKYNPKLIISDNRYAVRHRKVKSIIITHHLMLKMPKKLEWLEKATNMLIKRLVSKFDLCWIPDNPLPYSLAGDIVHKYPLPKNARLIGPISSFMDDYLQNHPKNDFFNKENKYDLLAIISGPEPQRSLLQMLLLINLSLQNIKCLVVTGTFEEFLKPDFTANITLLPHLDACSLAHYIKNTPIVVSRAGYSTIMDLWFLRKNAILIPTPGQTEQEYLAQKSQLMNHFFLEQSQIDKFNFTQHTINENNNTQSFYQENLLDKNINEILNR